MCLDNWFEHVNKKSNELMCLDKWLLRVNQKSMNGRKEYVIKFYFIYQIKMQIVSYF